MLYEKRKKRRANPNRSNLKTTKMSVPVRGERRIGFVKWFNKKAGYGFIKLLDPAAAPTGVEGGTDGGAGGEGGEKNDIFVHFSNIRPKAAAAAAVEDCEFRFLVKGEYIEFMLAVSNNPKYYYFASDVTGIFQGHIMCDMMTVRAPPPPLSPPDCNYALPLQQMAPLDEVDDMTTETDTLVISKRNRRSGGGGGR